LNNISYQGNNELILYLMKVFQTLSELPDGHKQILMDTISVRREDVRQALMSETNTISEAVLADFDWQVKVSRLANEKL
jgi:hypothetical protein